MDPRPYTLPPIGPGTAATNFHHLPDLLAFENYSGLQVLTEYLALTKLTGDSSGEGKEKVEAGGIGENPDTWNDGGWVVFVCLSAWSLLQKL